MHLLAHHGIDVVFDVGANEGHFARELRESGYRGRIVSFEPLSSAYAVLERAAARDALWLTEKAALGDASRDDELMISGNGESSSLLNMLPRHEQAAPSSAYVGTETVHVTTLDSRFQQYVAPNDTVLLKIDAQGYERRVLDGAAQSLPRIRGVQVELSLVPLYEGDTPLAEMISYLYERGFVLASFEPVFCDPRSGQLLQVDGLFFRDVPAQAPTTTRP